MTLLMIMLLLMMTWWFSCSSDWRRSASIYQFPASRRPAEWQRHARVGTGADSRTSPPSTVIRGGAIHRGATAAALGTPCRPTRHRQPVHGPRAESWTTVQVQSVRRDARGSGWIAVWVRASTVLAAYWRFVPMLNIQSLKTKI